MWTRRQRGHKVATAISLECRVIRRGDNAWGQLARRRKVGVRGAKEKWPSHQHSASRSNPISPTRTRAHAQGHPMTHKCSPQGETQRGRGICKGKLELLGVRGIVLCGPLCSFHPGYSIVEGRMDGRRAINEPQGDTLPLRRGGGSLRCVRVK